MGEIFGKVTSPKLKSNFSGPAGGSALERASPPKAGERFREEMFIKFEYTAAMMRFFSKSKID